MASNSMYRAEKTITRRVVDAAEVQQSVAPRKLAVFVTHGMGQQMPFETLASTAEGLADHMIGGSKSEALEFRVRNVAAGDMTLQRLEFDTHDANGTPVELHVYEGYWAHLTEDRVRLRDVMGFLYGGAINGLKGPLSYFDRYVFGRAVRYRLPWTARLLLLYITLVITFFVGINAVASLSVLHLFAPGADASGGAIPLLRGPVMIGFERILVLYLAWTLVVGCYISLSLHARRRLRRPSRFAAWRVLTAIVQGMTSFWYVLTLLSFLAMLALVIFNQIHPAPVQRLMADFTPWPRLWIVGLWLLLGAASWFARGKLVQFMGDVAVYVSTPKLSKFMSLRIAIKDAVVKAARGVFAMRNAQGEFEYDGIGLMGHSLGSVVIYDSLNSLLLQDELKPNESLNVAERTKILLTFGSPLDKTAFIFAQQDLDTAGTRGALAAAVQPLIQDYAKYRKVPWVNVYSRRDIIAGDLDYYDDPKHELYQRLQVQNIQDPDALTPIAAHIEHWMNPLIYCQMLEHLGLDHAVYEQ